MKRESFDGLQYDIKLILILEGVDNSIDSFCLYVPKMQ